MTAQLRIGVARVPQGRTGRPIDARAEASRLADRLPDHPGLLVIRHLELAPGAAEVGRERVETLRRAALRPAREPVPTDAAAVWFADDVELLVCLSDDLARGRAGEHWWWRGRLGPSAGPAAESLERVWLREARWVPATVAALHRMAPERAAATVALLGPTAAARVRLAVLAEHGVAPVRSVVGLRSAAASPRPADLDVRPPSARSPRPVLAVPPRAATGPDPVDPAVARLHPEARALLETALLLEAPVIPTVPGPEEAAAAERASSYEPDAAPALHVVPPSAEPTRPAAASAPAPVVLAAATDEDPERPRPPGEVVPLHPRSPGPGRRAPLPGPGSGPGSDDGDPPPWQHHPWQASGPAVPTALASLLYAVNLMPLLDRTPPRPGSGWAVVEALGRWLLRDLPPARRRELLRDPLLPLLATLDGREPDVPSPVRLGAATRPVRAFLDKHRIGAEAFVQPGRVLVSRTHVDVLLLLDHADPRVRVTGLDQDPGWVAALGRIVLFHFEDQP